MTNWMTLKNMTINNYPRLCGGIFFTLLLQARKQRIGSRERCEGKSDGLNDTDLLEGLIRIFNKSYLSPKGSSMKNATNGYKSCTHSTGDYLPFHDEYIIKSFDNRIQNEYSVALLDMQNFAKKYLDLNEEIGKYKSLVQALIEVIEKDESIGFDSGFYMQSRVLTKKRDLKNLKNVNLSNFLLGVWHYIVTNITDNKVGKETYDKICPQVGGGKRNYIGNFGKNIDYNISVTLDNVESESANEYCDSTIEVIATENNTDSASESQTHNSTYVFNFNQNGNNNTQIGCVKNFYARENSKK